MNDNESWERFENFVRTFGATRLLLQRAHEYGFLIEGVVLYSALMDGFCRMCLILNEQITKRTSDINEKYIYQNNGEVNFSERVIYKQALKRKIIGKKLFEELNTLYDIRNKVIHRFFISEVEYSHLEIVCKRYEQAYNELWRINNDLEIKQIKMGVGMTTLGPKTTKTDKAKIYWDIMKKIKSGSERNLARTLNCDSVEEIVEFASRRGLLDKCTCGHEKVYHIDFKIIKRNKSHDLDSGLTKCNYKKCSCTNYTAQLKENGGQPII